MIWKTLNWLDARYEVSDTGLVRSWASNSGGWRKRPRTLRLETDVNGYKRVEVVTPAGAKHKLVQRLVLQAFTGLEGPQANHLNGVRDDNRLVNLAWCTGSENILHAFRVLGKQHNRANAGRTGAANWNSRRVLQTALDGTPVRLWSALAEAHRAGYAQAGISRVCIGNRSHHAGFKWEFV